MFLGLIQTLVLVNLAIARSSIDTALQEKSLEGFNEALHTFAGLVVVFAFMEAANSMLLGDLRIGWRKHVSSSLIDKYFGSALYQLASELQIDNPDERIAIGIEELVELLVGILVDVVLACFRSAAFLVILSRIAPELLLLVLFSLSLDVVVICLILGPPIQQLDAEIMRTEADLRRTLIHCCDYAEEIVLHCACDRERRFFSHDVLKLMNVLRDRNWWKLPVVSYCTLVNWTTQILPVIIIARSYFEGKFDFGTCTNAFIAFKVVRGSCQLLTKNISNISRTGMCASRVQELIDATNKESACSTSKKSTRTVIPLPDSLLSRKIPMPGGTNCLLSLRDLTISEPNGGGLLWEGLTCAMHSGEGLFIQGPPGCGKSSLLRVLAGIRTADSGEISIVDEEHCLFIPQRPYMIVGSFRELLTYPRVQNYPELALLNVMQSTELSHLACELNKVGDWASRLSLGEQQRVSIARALLKRPLICFLDESTSSIDITTEHKSQNQCHLFRPPNNCFRIGCTIFFVNTSLSL